jgi:hypothetical protein
MADRAKPNLEISAICGSNFGWKKGCKRLVYRLDYFLLNFAYTSAHSIVYPVFTEGAGKGLLSQIRLVLRLENITSPGASC